MKKNPIEGVGRSPARRHVRTVSSVSLLISLVVLVVAIGCGNSRQTPQIPLGRAEQALSSITFVQVNYATPQSPVATVQVPFTAAQAIGDLNVVAVGWNDTTAQVVSVTDSQGNTYARAVGPTQRPGELSQSIYYANNIAAAAAGANTVTVTFNVAATFADVRILEYNGQDPLNPVDVISAGTGSGTISSTPAVNTTSAADLLFAANMVTFLTDQPGAGWTSRVITPQDGDIAEDMMVTAVASYTSTAVITGSGSWVQQMVAFRAATTPVQPPGPPPTLTAAAASSSQINLSWGASTGTVTSYLVERCAGAGCTNFIQVATTSNTSYANSGLVASTSYTYRVRATDSVGDLSGYSNTASATTAAPPTNPANVTATVISGTQINLSWTASTGSVSSYLIERCSGSPCTFSQIATSTGTSYSDTGLTPGTTYSYRIRASDAAGNLSGYSNVANATTTPPPSNPSNLIATAISSSQINLAWTASTGTFNAYLIERCSGVGCSNFSQIASTPQTQTTYSNTGLVSSTSYSYRVRANGSGYSNTATTTTAPPPSNPSNLTATAISSSQINLGWTSSTGSVSSYLIERCAGPSCTFLQIATTAGTTYSNTALASGTTYGYRVRASDAAGNLSGYSNTASAATPGQPPIASSFFVGFEDPLSENGAWVPLVSLSPDGTRFLKNNGVVYPDRFVTLNHAGARTTAAIPVDQYSEIVVGHLGDNTNNVGPIVRVQTSGAAIDSHYLWWASRTNGHNFLYQIFADGSSYIAQSLLPSSPVVDGDRLRLIARGPLIYGIKNGVRDFIYNSGPDDTRLSTGTVGMLAFVSTSTLTNATIASWSGGAAPASSGSWASSNFSGVEDPLDEGDRWFPLPAYSGFKKAGGFVRGKDPGHNTSAVWSITTPPRQYSEVTLGTVATGGGGPIVRVDRANATQTGWLLFLWADNPSQSGLYQMTADGTFLALQFFTPTIVSGDKWRLLADGNVLSVFRNGVLQFSYLNDGSYPTGDVGIEALTPAFTFSAWEGGDPTGH